MESNPTIPITKDYKVLVGCMTYNHSKYIVDALNGFAMQKTNFPFACIVIDDASTDGEQEVITDWLQKECDMERADFYDLELSNVIVVPHRTNTNCTMAVYLLKRNLYNEGNLKFDLVKDWGFHSEYLALCEGDDYWTDPEKLQIQFDYLNTHPEVDMCAHAHIETRETQETYRYQSMFRKQECIIPVETVILKDGYILATGSLFFRSNLACIIPDYRAYMDCDYTIMIQGAMRGGILFIPKIMSVYRTGVPNSWATKFFTEKGAKQKHFAKISIMLDILDNETNFKFHKHIEARKMLNSVVFANNKASNIANFRKHQEGFWVLSPIQRIKILCKCICPPIGRWIIHICSHNNIYPNL